ncbi:MAG: DNA polymerase III subunit delta [Candidatus Binataceae bacterium]
MAVEAALPFLRGLGERSRLAPVFLLAGPQPFIREYVLDALRARLARDGFQYRSYQVGAADGFAAMINELAGEDLFAPRRLVVCRVLRSHRERGGGAGGRDDGGGENQDGGESGSAGGRRAGAGGDDAALIAAIDRVAGPIHLALLYERDSAPARVRRKVEQAGIAINCMRPFDNQIAQYAEVFARGTALKLSREAADLLAARHGGDLGAIQNVIVKAAISCGERGRIEVSDLGEAGASRAPELFELSESVTRGRIGETIGLFDRAIQTGRDPIELLAVEIIPMVRRMLVAAAVLEKRKGMDEVGKALGYPSASALLGRAVDGARRFGLHRLKRAHRRACELDAQFKMGLLKEREQEIAGMLMELMAAPR